MYQRSAHALSGLGESSKGPNHWSLGRVALGDRDLGVFALDFEGVASLSLSLVLVMGRREVEPREGERGVGGILFVLELLFALCLGLRTLRTLDFALQTLLKPPPTHCAATVALCAHPKHHARSLFKAFEPCGASFLNPSPPSSILATR